MTSTTNNGEPGREIQVPKGRTDRGPPGAVVVGETARHFIARTGSRPCIRIVVVGGASFRSLWKDAPTPVAGETRGRAWELGDGDVEVELFIVTPLASGRGPAAFAQRRTGGPPAPLAAAAAAIARASLLVVDGAGEGDARHALKLAAVAAVPAAAFVVDADDGDERGPDERERDARAMLLRYGVDGDNAFALHPDFGARHDDAARLAAALARITSRLAPRLLPDDIGLVSKLELATVERSGTAGQSLFTGRCVVGATAAGATVTLAERCLPPPAKQIAWLDEANEVVAVRKVRR